MVELSAQAGGGSPRRLVGDAKVRVRQTSELAGEPVDGKEDRLGLDVHRLEDRHIPVQHSASEADRHNVGVRVGDLHCCDGVRGGFFVHRPGDMVRDLFRDGVRHSYPFSVRGWSSAAGAALELVGAGASVDAAGAAAGSSLPSAEPIAPRTSTAARAMNHQRVQKGLRGAVFVVMGGHRPTGRGQGAARGGSGETAPSTSQAG